MQGPTEWNSSQLDPAIIAALPRESKVTKFERHGVSDWAWTARVDTEQQDASLKSYFLKILLTPDAAARVLGEYTSMHEIYTTLPSIAPQPLAHGQCLADPAAHFFLCEYLHFTHHPTTPSTTSNTAEYAHPLPDPARLASKLAQLHRASASPTGQFGFHCTVFDGKLPLTVDWDASWPSFFARLLRDVYALDVRTNGVDAELDGLMEVVLKRVVPRLLGVLTGIRPVLIHGDLWEGNVGTVEGSNGEVVVYDACAYYAHHEKEVGIWRCEHHGMMVEAYRREYFRLMPPSEPVEEADDRNQLYAVETLLIHSAHFPGARTRQRAVEELGWLVRKYGGGV